MEFIKNNKIIIAIVLLSFFIPLIYSFVHRIRPAVDAVAYDNIAVNLIEGHGFKEDASKSYEFDTAVLRAGPGYEFFLAFLYKFFGHSYEIVWVVQALLHALTALVLFFIARDLFPVQGHAIGLWAAAIFGFHPDLIEIAAMLLTETLYLFLTVLVIWFFVKLYQKQNKIIYSIFLSTIMGVAILSRPPILLFVPVILFYYIWNRQFKAGIIFLLCLTAALTPWAVRNYLIFHQFILTTLIGECNLWLGNTLTANGGQISGGYNPVDAYTGVNGFFSFKQQASLEFKFFILNYPLIFIKLCLIRFIRYFSLIRPMGFWFYQFGTQQMLFVFSSVVSIIFLFISGFSGMVASFKNKKEIFYYFVALASISPLILIPTVVQSRYRFQIYPFLAILGGYFIYFFWQSESRDAGKKILFWVTLFFVAVSLIDVAMFWPTVVSRLGYFFSV